MARVKRARPPRPAPWRRGSVPAAPAGGPRLAWKAWLAAALLVATTLAFAGLPAAPGTDRPGGMPGDTGLTSAETPLWMAAVASAASLPGGGQKPVAAARLRAVTRPPAPALRLLARAPRARRTRVQRWYARRNLDGG
jgi:hypothetical protein